jgi:hypothetical protein
MIFSAVFLTTSGDDFRGDLFDDDEPLAERADLGEQIGEHLHRRGGGAVLGAGEQPVCLLEDRDVPEVGSRLRAVKLVQVFEQPDHDRAHEEGLLLAAGDPVEFEDGVAAHQLRHVQGMAALEKTGLRPRTQAAEADLDETADVALDLGAVGDVLDHLVRGGLQVGHRRVIRPAAGHTRDRIRRILASVGFDFDVPAGVGVHLRQRRLQDLRERVDGLECGDEEFADQVHVARQGVAGLRFERVQGGGRRRRVPGGDDDDRPVLAEAVRHPGVLRLRRFDDEPRHPPRLLVARQLFEQAADGVRLARTGGPADEDVAVQRRRRHVELRRGQVGRSRARHRGGSHPRRGAPVSRRWCSRLRR